MKSTVRYLAMATMLSLAACGGDDSVTPGNLTQEEAEELATAIFSQSFFDALTLNYAPPAQSPDGPALAQYTTTVETTAQCPMGGQVALDAVVDVDENDETGAGTVDFSVALVHAACVVQGEMGTRFTLTGDPSLVFDFLMTSDGQENLSFSGSITGAVAWATDGKEGSCSVGYEFSGETTQNGFGFQANGSVCGTQISESFSFSGSTAGM